MASGPRRKARNDGNPAESPHWHCAKRVAASRSQPHPAAKRGLPLLEPMFPLPLRHTGAPFPPEQARSPASCRLQATRPCVFTRAAHPRRLSLNGGWSALRAYRFLRRTARCADGRTPENEQEMLQHGVCRHIRCMQAQQRQGFPDKGASPRASHFCQSEFPLVHRRANTYGIQ